MLRRAIAVALLAALAASALSGVVWGQEKTSQHDVASELMCQCGCALTVAACQEAMECSIASDIVQEIDRQIVAGKSKPEIQSY